MSKDPVCGMDVDPGDASGSGPRSPSNRGRGCFLPLPARGRFAWLADGVVGLVAGDPGLATPNPRAASGPRTAKGPRRPAGAPGSGAASSGAAAGGETAGDSAAATGWPAAVNPAAVASPSGRSAADRSSTGAAARSVPVGSRWGGCDGAFGSVEAEGCCGWPVFIGSTTGARRDGERGLNRLTARRYVR